ncbi:flagellar biosynthesis repressor FlbT [Rhodocista pekingensis]|uniref:Flagellar biosynthesis repressor FlbT n=1 Tax=Rhodocista pekingensis TaxID=201185 RepID=A0ABW2L0R6_9PROT
MPLKLRLKAGEHLVVNGALIKAETSATLVLMNHARFMRDRQIMRPEEADSPARRIYFSVQNTYLAAEDERPAMLALQRDLVRDFHDATRNAAIREKLDELNRHIDAEDYYPALQLARDVITYEDIVLGRGSASTERVPAGGEMTE